MGLPGNSRIRSTPANITSNLKSSNLQSEIRNLKSGKDFRARVLAAVRRIPPGRVATYGDIAARAGRPRAWRAVGNIMRDCRDAYVPCHRVVAAAGRLGGYGGNLAVKRHLLRTEGISITESKVLNFPHLRWRGQRR